MRQLFSVTMERRKGLSGNAWKLIACLSMFIDHIGAALIECGVMRNAEVYARVCERFPWDWYRIDNVLRILGRAAFPIYCLLLVEGFCHTRNLWKYAGRLAVFGLLSEVPFDLAFMGQPLELGYQNVYWTLLIGLLTIAAVKHLLDQGKQAAAIGAAALGMVMAELIRSDYGALGAGFIVLIYVIRRVRAYRGDGPVFLGWAYNGERGKLRLTWFFYLFYPLHLLALECVRYLWLGFWY